MNYRLRHVRLRALLVSKKLPALLVTHLPDVRYLCGFTGSNAALAVVVNGRGVSARLFTDGRYTEQAKLEVKGATVRIVKGSALTAAAEFVATTAVYLCGYDASTTSVQMLSAMQKAVSSKEAKNPRTARFLKASEALVPTLREVKDDDEIAKLRAAAALGCELYEEILGWMEAGMREIDVAAELEFRARKAGAESMSFETIIASGVRSSMPHARATLAPVEPGSLLTMDFGIMLDGYCSDMTRTVYFGGSDAKKSRVSEVEQRTVFEAVLQAQQAAVASVRAGVAAEDVDVAARSMLRKTGFARFFTHSTGHGLGLEIHEAPRVATKQPKRLEAGNVITIEPGVYLPNRFGVRIEDTVLVTEDGCEVLTPSHRGWIEL